MKDGDDWRALPALLEGLHKGHSVPEMNFQEKIVRKAVQADQLSVVVRCLNRSALTGITLKNDNILSLTLWGLHEHAQAAQWDEERLNKALRYSVEIAQLLESEEHGSGRRILPNDPRTRPTTIAVFLELYAVLAQKYKGGKDVDGNVKKYADRLMSCLNESNQVFILHLRPQRHTY